MHRTQFEQRKRVLSVRTLSEQKQHVSEDAFCDKVKEMCMQAERIMLAHYFNAFLRYNNMLSLLRLHHIHILYTLCKQ